MADFGEGAHLREEFDAQGDEARAAADLLAYSDEGSLLYEMAALDITQRRKSITAGNLADDYLAHNGRPLVVETQGGFQLRAITDQGRLVETNVTVLTQLTPSPIACELETTSLLFWLAEEPAGERVGALQGSLRTLYDDQPPEAQEAADLLASAQADSLLYDLANLPHDQRSSAIGYDGSLYNAYVSAGNKTKAAASALADASNGSLLYNLAALDAPKRPGAIRPVGTLRSLYDEQGDNARNAADLLAGAQEGSLLYDLANLPHDQRSSAIKEGGRLRSLYDAEVPKVREAADLIASATSWNHEHRIKLDFSQWLGAEIADNATHKLGTTALSRAYELTWTEEEGPVFTSTGAIALHGNTLDLPDGLVTDAYRWSSPASVPIEDGLIQGELDVEVPKDALAVEGNTLHTHVGTPGYFALPHMPADWRYEARDRTPTWTHVPDHVYSYTMDVDLEDLKAKLIEDFEARDDSIVAFSEGNDGEAKIGDIMQATDADDPSVFLEVARLSEPKEQRGEGYVVGERLASGSTWRVSALDDDAYAVAGGVSWDGNLFTKKGQDDRENPYYLSPNERYMLRRSKAYPDLWVVLLSGLVGKDVNDYTEGETTGRLATIHDSTLREHSGEYHPMSIWNFVLGSVVDGNPTASRPLVFPDSLNDGGTVAFLSNTDATSQYDRPWFGKGVRKDEPLFLRKSNKGEVLARLIWRDVEGEENYKEGSYAGYTFQVLLTGGDGSLLYNLAGLDAPNRLDAISAGGSLRSLYDSQDDSIREAANLLAGAQEGYLLYQLA
ncbi:MAG: hypothetical protein VXZ20_00590, partial [Actinomycetota bacterium]|nr:hypothetical protein [Actinomycetota bacterium]